MPHLLHNLTFSFMLEASFWGLCMDLWVQLMASDLWAEVRWVFNPNWSMCLNLLWTTFPLCFGPFQLGLGYWGIMFSVCNGYVRFQVGIYDFVSDLLLNEVFAGKLAMVEPSIFGQTIGVPMTP